jgi:hypothetical protein
MGPHERSRVADLLALATDAEMADLIAMRDLADGAAIDAFRRAQAMSPFDFLGDRGIAVTATTAVDATGSPTLGTDSGAAMDACSCWSGTGNARSSCSKEIMESRSREIA